MQRFTKALLLIAIGLVLLPTGSHAQKGTRIRLQRANSMKNLKVGDTEYIRYLGNVEFYYDSTRINCDSAYYNNRANTFDAYGNVVVTQNTATITGDILHYDGNTSTGTLSGERVRMVDKETVLETRQVIFNSETNLIYYPVPGTITTPDLKLISRKGYYNRNRSLLAFADSVKMFGNDGTVYTDSLTYQTETKLANFFGPTRIVNTDGFIYCEKGWYNRQTEQSNFRQNAYIINGENLLYGDNIFYDKLAGKARATGNVIMVDTTNNAYLFGQKAYFNQNTENARVTDSPYLALIDQNDTLFLRADTLRLITVKPDSRQTDTSSYRIVKALYGVKFYRSDIQGRCDSLTFSTEDSVLQMYAEPVLWNEARQLTANRIVIHSANKQISRMELLGKAFIASQEAPTYFNQIRGKQIVALFTDGQLHTMHVTGNGQSIYFLREKDTITSVNRSDGSRITIKINNKKISRITFYEKPTSSILPLHKIEPQDVKLKGLQWLDNLRPKNSLDITEGKALKFPTTTNITIKKPIPFEERAHTPPESKQKKETNQLLAPPKK